MTCDVLAGRAKGEKRPDLVICVLDATNLRRNLRLVLAVRRMGLPIVVALNMADLAARRGIHVDPAALSAQLGLPVVRTVAIHREGLDELRALLDRPEVWAAAAAPAQADPVDDHVAVKALLNSLNLDH